MNINQWTVPQVLISSMILGSLGQLKGSQSNVATTVKKKREKFHLLIKLKYYKFN